MQQCSNCAAGGHTFRDCPEPVTSFGVIAFRYPRLGPAAQGHLLAETAAALAAAAGAAAPQPPQPQFLLIRRKDSLGYVELLRGRYDARDPAYVLDLLDKCTLAERARLLEPGASFDALWLALWSHQATRQYRQERDAAHAKFERLRGDAGPAGLAALARRCTTAWLEPEWGLPKGRRNPHEREVACALREFAEEAGVPPRRVVLARCGAAPIWLTEAYTGSNGVRYKHRYALARCDADEPATLHDNAVQRREVSAVRWAGIADAAALLRPYHAEKRRVLEQAAALLAAVAVLPLTSPAAPPAAPPRTDAATYHPPQHRSATFRRPDGGSPPGARPD
jgi:8-oxo-dGTP pyrophosphatase MutT (NUDIX family)